MSVVFVTGGTGYLGSYAVTRLVQHHDAKLALLVRAKSRKDAIAKLWNGLQMHAEGVGAKQAEWFERILANVTFVSGDLTAPHLGMDARVRAELAERTGSILHIAASLNRRSEKACLNANLRGTLSVIGFAKDVIARRGSLGRFTDVSTVAVCGRRYREVVQEDASIDWDRSDYDPYARTKKFAEHMVEELLPDVDRLVVRPSIVMGDSRFPQTTQFDMVRSFCALADMPVLPMSGAARLDIVNADFVGRAIADLHQKKDTRHRIYHLSSGTGSKCAEEIGVAMLSKFPGRKPPRFVPRASGAFEAAVNRMANLPKGTLSLYGALLKVFWPYIVFDTVFDHTRVCEELGGSPVPFTDYCGELYRWSREVKFTYPYQALPERLAKLASPSQEVTSWA
ncbi:MAG: SDR family oxidoreductase [Sandaracinus sp.]